jgi:hypothetical protein
MFSWRCLLRAGSDSVLQVEPLHLTQGVAGQALKYLNALGQLEPGKALLEQVALQGC